MEHLEQLENQELLTDELDYELPPDRIAQAPLHPRDHARMLVAIDPAGDVAHMQVKDLPLLLGPGDLLVLNETKVMPARLDLFKSTGGKVEVLLLEPLSSVLDESRIDIHEDKAAWLALIRPGRRIREGMTLYTSNQIPLVTVGSHYELQPGVRVVYLHDEQVVHQHGRIALPPYIRSHDIDLDDYQTVYARSSGSVAAPTAGLHLSKETLERIVEAGAKVATVDLKIGLDTFRPILTDRVDDHVIHSEVYKVDESTMEQCLNARRVVAVGTTVVRALESAAVSGVLEGRTSLFIKPGYQFQLVDLLLTNFHIPRSTLLALVHAFVGPRWKELYRLALQDGYRFLSFGDAMLIARSELPMLNHSSFMC